MHLRKLDSPEAGSFELVESRVPASYQPTYSSLASEQTSVFHYFRVLQKRKWLVLATLIVVFTIAVVATLRMTRMYEARSRLAIFPETPNVLNVKEPESGYYGANDDDTDTALQTQVEILHSDALALKVIESMHLDQDPNFAGARSATSNVGVSVAKLETEPDPARIASLLGRFRGGVTVQVVPRTRLIEIRYIHPRPQLATEIVNELARTFIEENFRTKYETVMQTSDWLSKELSDVQLKMESSEEKLVRYQKEHGILGIDEKQNIVTTKLDSLNKDLTDAQTDRMQKEADYKLAGSGEPIAVLRVANSAGVPSLLDKLQEKEADLKEQYAQVTTAFGSAYPKTIELQNQLAQVRASMVVEQGRIREKLKNQYLAALQREKLLQAAFERQKQDANELNQSAIEFTSLKRDAESNRELYLNMLQRLKEAGVTAGLRSSNIRVVDVARVPTSPVKPNVNRNLAIGLLVGLAAGIALAFLMETIDSTVRNLEEITAVSALPALGTIPMLAESGRRRGFLLPGSRTSQQSSALVTCYDPRSQAAESYRALRTSILLSSSSAPPKVLLVTSALQDEGKTTISANSAIVLAQKGSRVLLIDADLRRPGLGQMLGLESSSGLSTLLSGVDNRAHLTTPIPEVPTLTVLSAGPIPPNPAELLSSETMKAWLTRWRNEFDYIVIDSPPCLSVTDAVALSVDADKVIFVARSGQTTKAALKRASEVLSHVNANVMGVVLNCLDSTSEDYYTYYNPKYGYRAYGKEPDELRKATS